MSSSPKYYIIDAAVLPGVFLRVAEAKRILETGEASTVNDAVRMVEISRSAFYKYKDSVRPFSDMLHGRIVTTQIILRDEPGVLSEILKRFAETGCNILTINQSIPTNGCAIVTIAVETSGLKCDLEQLIQSIDQLKDVIRCETLAG